MSNYYIATKKFSQHQGQLFSARFKKLISNLLQTQGLIRGKPLQSRNNVLLLNYFLYCSRLRVYKPQYITKVRLYRQREELLYKDSGLLLIIVVQGLLSQSTNRRKLQQGLRLPVRYTRLFYHPPHPFRVVCQLFNGPPLQLISLLLDYPFLLIIYNFIVNLVRY